MDISAATMDVPRNLPRNAGPHTRSIERAVTPGRRTTSAIGVSPAAGSMSEHTGTLS